MKKFVRATIMFGSAAALCLGAMPFSAVPAFGADQGVRQPHQQGQQPPGQWQQQQGQGQPGAAPPPRHGGTGEHGPAAGPGGHGPGPYGANRRYDWHSYKPGRRPPEWRRYRRDFNPKPYEYNRRAERRFHWRHYVRPKGWYYRQWRYGEILPRVFWAQRYWLSSYWRFGLMNPPYGFVWIRYGDDALLVDVQTGMILSVEYGLFY